MTGITSIRPEFRVGLRSLPYLADHAFQDMVVLPGSFYVDMALSVERAHSGRIPGVLRNIAFNSPVILSAEDSVIKLETRDLGDGLVEYTFYEAGAEQGGAQPSARRHAARLEIDRHASTSHSAAGRFVEPPQTPSLTLIEGERFYETLRENGNQYGPRFRNVSSIWRAGDQVVARFRVPNRDLHGERHCLHPALLDSVTQLLAPFMSAQGRTFVLRSIERLEVSDVEFPEELWGHATLLPQGDGDATTFLGDIRVFDGRGKTYLELSRVAFTLLERSDAAEPKPATKLVVAANFTAEPLEDSLKFWGEHFGVGLGIEFAPYNQVFQQLLDPGSALRRNSGGVNVVALALEEWARRDPPALDLGKEKAEQCFGARARRVLPNGLEIVHLNRYETDYVYQEIFEDQCYLKHGIRLRDGDTVVDIGANIGLFSLFVMSRCANPRILAFEPAPAVYELLKANCDAYGSGARAFNLGVSDRPKTERFTFYEKSSVFSGFHSDETVDRAAIQAIVRNMLKGASVAAESVEEYVNELTADRLLRTTHECRLTSLSHIIREQQLERIDLLKIDAEKSELDILQGIDEGDWAKIGQIVIEIHDPSGEAIERVRELLAAKGFRCAVEQETLLERAGLYNLYAIRDEAGEVPATGARTSLERNVGEFCAALRSFMNHTTAPLVLSICPRTPAAAADAGLKAALDEAEQALIAEAGGLSNVRVIGSASALRRYPLDDYYDAHAHRVGHVPYTPECYAAIGTAVFRAIYNLQKNPFKVIVLDCDNTLWKGVCSEDGPHGVELTPPFRALQEFMLAQTSAGMVLCLCSKNNENDALEVFDQRSDMLLKREHLVSWRINWKAKSENLRSLAQELDLGLDSFIFVDDNPVECAEVRINCPEVLTLQLPRDTEALASFLDHVWAFDRAGATAEDRSRTRMYQQNRERHRYREESLSLKDFVKGLELRLDVAAAAESDLERVSQLTRRTNQFNLTTLRRSEAEIRAFLKRAGTRCLVVRAADRFGDYGLVGVLMVQAEADRYKVDTLLLSCRVLGRGVEHELVSRLARQALEEGKKLVELPFVPSGKNQPALEFLTSLGDADGSWCFPAERLARLEYDPGEKVSAGNEAPAGASPRTLVTNLSERLQRIGEGLSDIGKLAKAIEEHRIGKQPVPAAAGNALEIAITNIWRKVLGNPRIGINDNFFEVGGTSLRAVQVVATIKRELDRTLSIVSVFECPTVRLLAARLAGTSAGAGAATATATAAAARGRERRYNTARTKAS